MTFEEVAASLRDELDKSRAAELRMRTEARLRAEAEIEVLE
jgi:hypothetical protein